MRERCATYGDKADLVCANTDAFIDGWASVALCGGAATFRAKVNVDREQVFSGGSMPVGREWLAR